MQSGGIALSLMSAMLSTSSRRKTDCRAKRGEFRMQIERVNTKDLVVNSMPDGSRVIRNSNNETVFALNATAAAAWDACSSATTIAGVAEEMRRSFDPNVTDELAEACIVQFEEKKLVKISGRSSQGHSPTGSRRVERSCASAGGFPHCRRAESACTAGGIGRLPRPACQCPQRRQARILSVCRAHYSPTEPSCR